jgi:hypothetical protein
MSHAPARNKKVCHNTCAAGAARSSRQAARRQPGAARNSQEVARRWPGARSSQEAARRQPRGNRKASAGYHNMRRAPARNEKKVYHNTRAAGAARSSQEAGRMQAGAGYSRLQQQMLHWMLLREPCESSREPPERLGPQGRRTRPRQIFCKAA